MIEIDNQIAERVFDWKWITCKESCGSFNAGRAYLREGDEAVAIVKEWPQFFMLGLTGDPIKGPQAPAYSTDIAEAWKVVEQLGSENLWATVVDTVPNAQGSAKRFRYRALFTDAEFTRAEQYADTAPMAICKAALAAVREVAAEV